MAGILSNFEPPTARSQIMAVSLDCLELVHPYQSHFTAHLAPKSVNNTMQQRKMALFPANWHVLPIFAS